MSQTLHFLEKGSLAFPSPHQALTDPNGLLAVGGDLSPKRLITAYRNGIFPWFSHDEPIMWWSPDPRAVILLDDIRINRTLRKVLNRQVFQVSVNKAFPEVVSLCANAPFRKEDTWIVPSMKAAYIKLNDLGHAHSIEVWQDNALVGGLYGVAINGYFSGESMFYKTSNASKVALVYLAELLSNAGIKLIDCQILNPFLADMGAREISREQFIQQKDEAMAIKLSDDFWQARIL